MTTPKVYVGTYAKYNSGSIQGAWVYLENFITKEGFLEKCADLHGDESDPEFMFQDYEGFPEAFYGESGLSDDIWEWLSLDDNDREIWAAYRQAVDSSGTLEQAQDAYYGKFDSDTDLAYEYIESTGLFHGIPASITIYFDYERFGRDLAYDYSEHEGHYFFNH